MGCHTACMPEGLTQGFMCGSDSASDSHAQLSFSYDEDPFSLTVRRSEDRNAAAPIFTTNQTQFIFKVAKFDCSSIFEDSCRLGH